MPKKNLLFLLFPLFLLAACAPKPYVNKEYARDGKEPVKLAFIPFYGDRAARSDSLIDIMFKDSSRPDFYFPVRETRKATDGDGRIKDIVAKIIAKDYSKQELKENPGLLELVDAGELSTLRQAYGNSTHLLVPINFFAGLHLGRAFGLTLFRLYDFKSGKLIYEKRNDVNTAYTGEESILRIAILSMATVRTDFRQLFESKYGP